MTEWWTVKRLEAAMKAGLAHYKAGEWVFINDKLRDMLEAFGRALEETA